MSGSHAFRLYDHEHRIQRVYPTLQMAIEAAKAFWDRCLIVIGPSNTILDAPICVYRDEEDMADEKAVGEIRYEGVDQ